MVFEALDRFDSQVGEEVVVTFGSMGRGQAMIVLYGLPLVAFLIGAIVGNQLALFGSPDLSGLVLSLVATAVAMAGIRLYSIRNFEQDKEYQPVVSKRLGYPVPEPEEDPC
jgi:positive regulator of sigma E activity